MQTIDAFDDQILRDPSLVLSHWFLTKPWKTHIWQIPQRFLIFHQTCPSILYGKLKLNVTAHCLVGCRGSTSEQAE